MDNSTEKIEKPFWESNLNPITMYPEIKQTIPRTASGIREAKFKNETFSIY